MRIFGAATSAAEPVCKPRSWNSCSLLRQTPGRHKQTLWQLQPVTAASACAFAASLRPRCRSTGRCSAAKRGVVSAMCSAADGSVGSRCEEDVIVFSRAGCPYCVRAKALLSSRGVPFGVVDIGVQPERRKEASELSGSSTVPQVFVGRRYLGGFDALQELDEGGGLLTATCRSDEDGASIPPTPPESLAAGTLPEAVLEKLSPRAEAIAKLQYQAGSRPSLRAFLRYAITSRPAQDQGGNLPLNLAAAPGEALPPPALPAAGAGELAALLRQVMLQLLDDFRDPLSSDVDYLSMRKSKQWGIFMALAAELGEPRLKEELVALDGEDRKAFFVNLYNAMTFHGIVTFGRRPGWWYLYCFFITPAVSYRLAGVQISLDDVEHGLLRARPDYFEDDAQELQRRLRLPQLDARIHMALNCGAKGCPAVATFSGGKELSAELDEAVAGFVADEGNVQVRAGADGHTVEVKLSSLFKMYIEDFAGSGAKPGSEETRRALARWLLPFVRGEKHELLAKAAMGSTALKFEWLPYDWETNGPEVPLDSHIYTPTW